MIQRDDETSEIPVENGAEDSEEVGGAEESTEAVSTPGPSAFDSETVPTPSIVEAILFASDAPVGAQKIANVIGDMTPGKVKECIAGLNAKYEETGAAFRIEEIARGFQILTLPEYNVWLRKLLKVRSESRLSSAALETLAVVAYKQPVLRAKIEEIRGVGAGEMLNRLREMNLVKIVGRAEELGRPLLYGTTKRFLEVFGLASLDELPKIEELTPPERQSKPQAESPDSAESTVTEDSASAKEQAGTAEESDETESRFARLAQAASESDDADELDDGDAMDDDEPDDDV